MDGEYRFRTISLTTIYNTPTPRIIKICLTVEKLTMDVRDQTTVVHHHLNLCRSQWILSFANGGENAKKILTFYNTKRCERSLIILANLFKRRRTRRSYFIFYKITPVPPMFSRTTLSLFLHEMSHAL